jgi:uncharacterized protein
MDELDFAWDSENVRHIAEHRVSPAEAEQAFSDPTNVTLETSIVDGEEREAIVGMTATGRILVVVVTERAGRIRVVTARRATRSEQAYYHRRGV